MRKPTSDDLRDIGIRVREARKSANFTQETLAEMVGVSKSFVSEIETGQSAANGLTYLKLSRALDIGVHYLLTGEEQESIPTDHEPEVSILPAVARLAENEGWTYRHALEVSAQVTAVVARRTRAGGKWEPTDEYLTDLYEALRREEADA